MALGTVRIPQLQQSIPVVDNEGRMTNEFARRLNEILGSIANALNAIAVLPEIQEALLAAQDSLVGLDKATEAAKKAADTATAAAAATKREAALQGSYISPDSVLSASTTTITVAAHTRYYADGTSVVVNAGTVPATAAGDTDYVSYSDPTRAGGNVNYIASTTPPTQTSDTHVVGAILIPQTGVSEGGSGPRRPGYVAAKFPEPEPGPE